MSAKSAPPPRRVHEFDLEPLAELVSRTFPRGGGLACEPMPGGASTRRYFRVKHPEGTAVAMFSPEGPKAEEVAPPTLPGRGPVERWPFLEVRELLASHGVDVPTLYGEDTARGWILLEDLGDDTLANYLASHPDRREPMYVRAVTDLARAQDSLQVLPAGSVVGTRAFDEDLLEWEIHHFREWALEARGAVLSADDHAHFGAIASRLARRIASWPRAFVHRDYQSRNLMVRGTESLCWIDFQDALLGPRAYDLVALLSDSYQIFDRPFVEARLDDYSRSRGLDARERTALGREFDFVTVQRKLKDAGRFVFVDRVNGNSRFLEFVEPTIAKVVATLARLGDDEDMRALALLLDRALP